MTSAFSWQNSIILCPDSFCTPRPNLPVTPGVSWLPTFAFQSSTVHEIPMNSMKRQKDRTLKDELPRSVSAQNATGEEWRNNSRENEEMEPKGKQRPVVDVTGDGSKVQCCEEQYCTGAWRVRSLNQCNLEVVKQEVARVNIDILGISELNWTRMGFHCVYIATSHASKNTNNRMGEFNSDDHFTYFCGQEYLRRNGVALTVNNDSEMQL